MAVSVFLALDPAQVATPVARTALEEDRVALGIARVAIEQRQTAGFVSAQSDF